MESFIELIPLIAWWLTVSGLLVLHDIAPRPPAPHTIPFAVNGEYGTIVITPLPTGAADDLLRNGRVVYQDTGE